MNEELLEYIEKYIQIMNYNILINFWRYCKKAVFDISMLIRTNFSRFLSIMESKIPLKVVFAVAPLFNKSYCFQYVKGKRDELLQYLIIFCYTIYFIILLIMKGFIDYFFDAMLYYC